MSDGGERCRAEPAAGRAATRSSSGSRSWSLIVIATVNTLRSDEGGILGAERGRGGRAAAGVRGARAARRRPTRDANVFQDDCETSEQPLSGRRPPHPRLRRSSCRT